MTLYAVIKFVHVLLAIVAVGFTASYGISIARAAREPQHLGHVLRSVKALDDRWTTPAYVLLFVTGVANVLVGSLDLTTFWIAAAITLWALLVVGGYGVYAPTLRRQIAALDAGGPTSPEYARSAARGRLVGIVLATLLIVIVFLMVTKPSF